MLRRRGYGAAKLEREVFPCWVYGFDDGDLLGTSPMLQLFLASDGVQNILEMLVVDQAVDVVESGVGSWPGFSVDREPPGKTVGDSDVEVAGAAGEDVDPEVVFASHREKGNSVGAKTEADSLRE